MKRIQVLDKHTCNQIAAGEVVERPSSVVKELVENSIDANSKNIRVELVEGGHKSIRIIDDGDGIHPEDVETAFMTHATSKIKGIQDVYSVMSLGFRGEALPSIASVSKTRLSSKRDDEEMGKEIYIEGGEIKEHKDVGRGKGTTVEVNDIFFNVPARQKFLKTPSKEGAAVNDLLMRLAVCNPGIAFSFFRDGKKVFATKGTGELNETIRSIYGKETSNNIISFENQNEYSTIHGFIGNEAISRGSRSRQTIFVNGRYIKNMLITTAVERAFKSFLTVNKFPFFVLFINIAPDLIDVNIHPAKSEIKFTEDRGIFKLVFDGVHSALKSDLEEGFLNEEIVINNSSLKINTEKLQSLHNELSGLENMDKEKINIPIPIDLKGDKEGSDTPVKEEKSFSFDMNLDFKPTPAKTSFSEEISAPKTSQRTTVSYEPSFSSRRTSAVREDDVPDDEVFLFKNEVKKTPEVYEQQSYISADEVSVKVDTGKFPMPRVIGQYDKTYILAEISKTLYIIDQHAAHEKILFEKYSKEIDAKSVTSQILGVPVVVNLTPEEFACFEENEDVFKGAGFLCEDFGGNSVSIREIPEVLKSIKVHETFMTFLYDLMKMGDGVVSKIKFDKIASHSCRMAVKANDHLNIREMEVLLEELRHIDEPFTCPHGRPTILKFTTTDIEKMFKRIQ